MSFMSNHTDPKKVFVIVPAYNEQSVIREVVQELVAMHYKVVVVDDGSAKSMYPFIQGLPVFFLQHEVNLGQGAALQTGIEFAREHGAQYIVTFDGDGQHNANDIEKLLEPLRSNETDFTLGSRFLEGSQHNMSSGREKTLHLARLINYIFTGMKFSDANKRMRGFKKKN